MNSFDVFKVMWLTVLSASLTSLPVFGISITSPVSANDLVNVILGPDFPAVRNVTYTGAGAARGTFDGGLASGIGFDSGILLSTGHASSAPGPNSSAATSQHHNLEGDTDLDDLLGVPTFDAAVLKFEFTLSSTADLEFRYVFASEEYSEYVGGPYNDVFGFFLFTPSGDRLNLALVPGTGDRVSVNTVNPTANSQYFVNNDYDPLGSPYNLEYDGFTTVFTAQALGLTPGTYRMKLAIADTADHLVDSAVFIQAGSFRIVPDAGGTLALMSLALGSLSWVAWRRRSDGLA